MAATSDFGVPRSNDQAVDGMLSGWHWSVTSLTYSFPATKSFYEYGPERQTFDAFNATQKNAATAALRAIAGFADVTFTRVTESSSVRGDLRFAESDAPETAYAFYPGPRKGGDAWFNKLDYNTPRLGTYAYHTILHEIGHSMGLKHPHELDNFGRVPAARNTIEFSVMSYRSYAGSTIKYLTYAADSAPQSYMMLDIAALQHMYGANFQFRASDTVYSFGPSTGVMFVNGNKIGDPAGDTIFRTIWDGGGVDTFDLRNYTTNLRVDLNPGSWSLLSSAQRADLGDGHFARGNVFNALLYHDDTRSLIENVNAGRGNDVVRGNAADNTLSGGGGTDLLFGADGSDRILGGNGDDRLRGNSGDDFLYGGAGNDNILGGFGNDTIDGGQGNDQIDGGAGNDILAGSTGNDTAYFSGPQAAYTVSTLDGTTTVFELAVQETDTLTGIEAIQFSDFLLIV